MDNSKLEQAKNRFGVYDQFLQIETDVKGSAEKLAFLDSGIKESPYQKEITNYPTYLQTKPDGLKVVSYNINQMGTNNTFSPYPKLGEIPKINDQALSFIHKDITEACICIGTFVNSNLQVTWLGRNALREGQFWSSTKIIPILNVVSQINGKYSDCDIETCLVRDPDKKQPDHTFFDLAQDAISYADKIATSNSISAMFKRFETRTGLEKWVQQVTGNKELKFQGDYGEPAYITNPKLWDQKNQKVLLNAADASPKGDNLVSAYDLTRFMSMVGWHLYLPQSSRLPAAQWNSLKSVVKALGNDSARYTDVALQMLGLEDKISSPVILSKLGHGWSETRKVVETIYTAFAWFIDERPKAQGKPPKLRTFAMTLKGTISTSDEKEYEKEAVNLDASIAAEVTEILRRIFTEELP